MTIIMLPVATMVIGFLLGVVTTDTFSDNRRINDLERKLKRLERRVNG